MVDIKAFLRLLEKHGVSFFTGVPDSHLNDFCLEVLHSIPAERHVIAANEGNAIALAAGYWLGKGGLPLVYMQNSGLGNAVNPLVSLCDRNVYSVPMVLLIGWRGDPAVCDHAQHKTQGKITPKLLEDMHIPYRILSEENAMESAAWAADTASEQSAPAALVVKKQVLAAKEKDAIHDESYPLSREEAMRIVLDTLPADTIYAATTGRAARELHALRDLRGEDHGHDFLNVGSMGHASSAAQGMALACPERTVVCFDGDAAALMHLGSWTTAGKLGLPNFLHIVLNNGVHESVGGQPSAGWLADLTGMARAAGYAVIDGPATDAENLRQAVLALRGCGKPGFIDMRIHAGLRPGMPPLKADTNRIIAELKNELRNKG